MWKNRVESLPLILRTCSIGVPVLPRNRTVGHTVETRRCELCKWVEVAYRRRVSLSRETDGSMCSLGISTVSNLEVLPYGPISFGRPLTLGKRAQTTS